MLKVGDLVVHKNWSARITKVNNRGHNYDDCDYVIIEEGQKDRPGKAGIFSYHKFREGTWRLVRDRVPPKNEVEFLDRLKTNEDDFYF